MNYYAHPRSYGIASKKQSPLFRDYNEWIRLARSAYGDPLYTRSDPNMKSMGDSGLSESSSLLQSNF